jgi:asparagine synthase (glutamine-hydrolysing)
MTALGGFWGLDGRPGAQPFLDTILRAQSRLGARQSTGSLGDLALGLRLHPLLPEDRYDRQPLIGGDGRFALVADLRLDNRSELAGSLRIDPAKAARLADSSLLLLALERWGDEAVPRLLGDFAFAFYDAGERRLVLARDPLGQRPLFYHRGSGFLAFASMPSGLLALPEVDKAPDETAVFAFLASLPRTGPGSFYEGIERVEPGHMVVVTPDRIERRRHWRPQPRRLGLKTFQDHVEAYRAELDAAVARRLRGAEGLVAAHLSGGWDSNATTATAARLTAPAGGRVIAFTHVPGLREEAGSPANRFSDESSLAAATAALYPNVEHVRMPGSCRSPLADLDLYVSLYDRPVFNLCNHVWLSEIRSAARVRGARVLLSGEIGNWTISASPSTLLGDMLSEGRLIAWAHAAWAMVRGRRARLRGIAASSFGQWLPKGLWDRVAGLSSSPPATLTDPINPSLRGRAAELAPPALRRGRIADASDALLEMDWGENRKGILGGWGIDKRDPTADTRLIDFCLSLPLDMLLKGAERRPLARAALADRVAPAVLDERRKGYQSADWHVGLSRDRERIAQLLDAMAADELAVRLIDIDALRRLVAAWPSSGWEDGRTIGAYRIGLLKALTAGHFILAARG